MRRYAALVNLALVFVLMFGAAFSCGQNNNDRKSSTQTSENTDRTPRLDRPTEEDVRQLVTRRKEATSIESVEFGSSHRASLNDQDKGVPEDATVYAVRVRYTYKNGYRIDQREEEEYYAFDFYINKYGQWDAILRGPVANQPAG